MKNKKKLSRKKIKKQKAQIFPAVVLIAGALAILASAMLYLFQREMKLLVKHSCIIKKQELASVALEHALYKLQQGTNWDKDPSEIEGLYGYQKEFSTPIGNYTLHVAKGNLFLNNPSDPTSRQGQNEYRTIGIKVKSTITACTGSYYAVVKRVGFGGPLIVKGILDLPCNNNVIDNNGNANYEFYWGDVYCGKEGHDNCRIPLCSVGKGDHDPQYWMPHVYAKGDIYTAVNAQESSRNVTYEFSWTYDPMSPTAHAHPYSEFAQIPDIDFDYFKMIAHDQGGYYGPPTLSNGSPNPYYINDGNHDLSDVTNSNIDTLTGFLAGGSSADLTKVLFIDTTNALPVTPTASSWNTYNGKITVNSAGDGSDGTIRWYKDDNDQKYTAGTMFIMGSLILVGDDPDKDGNNDNYVCGNPPDNFYYPQTDDGNHFDLKEPPSNSELTNVKHHGFIYVGGELRIGGPRVDPDPNDRNTPAESNICIWGTVFIGEQGRLTVDRTNDEPLLYIYYDPALNMFGFTGSSVVVMSFQEFTFLIPTPEPEYPSSF